jgi:phospholipid N-methyltransferase
LRHAARVDGNQAEIVQALRVLGFDVDIVSREKKLYDIVVSGVPSWAPRPVAVRVEIKTDEKAQLTKDERLYWIDQKHRDNLIRAHSVEDVLRWFGKV